MNRIELVKLSQSYEAYAGKTIVVCGWVKTIRDSKAVGFIELSDGSAFSSTQVVFEESRLDNYKEVTKLGAGAAIAVTGDVAITPGAKQPYEIKASAIETLGVADADYPLQKKRHSLEFLRSIAHLRPRANTFQAVFRIRSAASFAVHRFFNDRGFVYVHTPIITGSDAEGAGEMFRVTTLDSVNPPLTESGAVDFAQDFFGKQTSLTVSGQLEAESMALAFGKVYTFGPTFRAENSNTARHAAEFWMIEPEIAFAGLDEDMALAKDLLQSVLDEVLKTCPEEMRFLNDFIDKGLIERLEQIIQSDFARVSYTEAIRLLEPHQKEFSYPVSWGADLQTEHERFLTEHIFKAPIFVTDYPKEIKAFYMRLNDDEKTVAAMDCLVPGVGEIIGGSQREERLDVLERRMKEIGIDPADYGWYMDLRRYGGVQHAGFGLGFERLLMYMTGIANIRDVMPFPRTTGWAEF
ncbi:MAG: asparagine--tRNA ligase [Peptococcaceae bacterium]|jgi:asparaginyl-tRNA synthetase|nr:asparagine--tRNA ligase [Peptococcaceae bacterium]